MSWFVAYLLMGVVWAEIAVRMAPHMKGKYIMFLLCWPGIVFYAIVHMIQDWRGK